MPPALSSSMPLPPDPVPGKVLGYRSGQCRNNDRALSHTYAMMADGDLWPMHRSWTGGLTRRSGSDGDRPAI
jgi:hypothetical protein